MGQFTQTHNGAVWTFVVDEADRGFDGLDWPERWTMLVIFIISIFLKVFKIYKQNNEVLGLLYIKSEIK